MEKELRIRLYCAAALAALAAAGGCTDAGGSLIIVQNQVPEAGCSIPSTQGANFRSRGRIDVAAPDGYLFTPLVESLITTDASGGNARVIAVEGADVELSFLPGLFTSEEESELRDAALSRFSEALSGSVFPGGTTSFPFIIVPRTLLQRIGGKLDDGESTQVIAEVTIFGTLNSGGVESNPFRYPVDVCDGCMIVDNGACASLPASFEPSVGGECNLLQDVPLDCCTEADQTVTCPAEAPSA